MLCITRKHGEIIRFVIGKEEFTVRCEFDGSSRMKFGIDAGANVTVLRDELLRNEPKAIAGGAK